VALNEVMMPCSVDAGKFFVTIFRWDFAEKEGLAVWLFATHLIVMPLHVLSQGEFFLTLGAFKVFS